MLPFKHSADSGEADDSRCFSQWEGRKVTRLQDGPSRGRNAGPNAASARFAVTELRGVAARRIKARPIPRTMRSGDGKGGDRSRRVVDGLAPMDRTEVAGGRRERRRVDARSRPERGEIGPGLDELGRRNWRGRRRLLSVRTRRTRAGPRATRAVRKRGLTRWSQGHAGDQRIEMVHHVARRRVVQRIVRATGSGLRRGEEAASQERRCTPLPTFQPVFPARIPSCRFELDLVVLGLGSHETNEVVSRLRSLSEPILIRSSPQVPIPEAGEISSS